MPARIAIEDCTDAFTCPEGVDVLRAMAALGRKGIPVGCRGGGCGVCKVRVLSGPYRTGKMSRARVTVEEQQQGYALACKLYALGDLHVRVAGKMSRAFDPAWLSVHCSEAHHAPSGSASWRKKSWL